MCTTFGGRSYTLYFWLQVFSEADWVQCNVPSEEDTVGGEGPITIILMMMMRMRILKYFLKDN